MDLDAKDGRVCVQGDEPVEVSKEYGPLVFWSLRLTACIDTCEWIVEQESDNGWIERTRIPGQPPEYYVEDKSGL